MSRGLRIGNKVGYPVIKAPSLILTSITLTPSQETQVVTASPGAGYNEIIINPTPTNVDENILPENIKPGVSILGVEGSCDIDKIYYVKKELSEDGTLQNSDYIITTDNVDDIGNYGLYYAFYKNNKINNVVLNCKNISGKSCLSQAFAESSITSIDFSSIEAFSTTIYTGTNNELDYCFRNCYSLHTVYFSKLSQIDVVMFRNSVFSGCSDIHIYFPALKSSSFGTNNALNNILNFTSNGILHFPSNLEAAVSVLNGYPNFGNSSTTQLMYDLPITE